jgi:hypothetical protein
MKPNATAPLAAAGWVTGEDEPAPPPSSKSRGAEVVEPMTDANGSSIGARGLVGAEEGVARPLNMSRLLESVTGEANEDESPERKLNALPPTSDEAAGAGSALL